MKIVRLLLLAVLLVPLSSCSAFRAQLGVGIGLGAMVNVPLLVHAGVGGGTYYRVGRYYDHTGVGQYDATQIDWFAFGISHYEGRFTHAPGFVRSYDTEIRHACFGIYPILAKSMGWEHDRSYYALEVGVAALFFEVWVGINPWYWFNDPTWQADPKEAGGDWGGMEDL